MELIPTQVDEFGRFMLRNTDTNMIKSLEAWSHSFQGDSIVQEQLAVLKERHQVRQAAEAAAKGMKRFEKLSGEKFLTGGSE